MERVPRWVDYKLFNECGMGSAENGTLFLVHMERVPRRADYKLFSECGMGSAENDTLFFSAYGTGSTTSNVLYKRRRKV